MEEMRKFPGWEGAVGTKHTKTIREPDKIVTTYYFSVIPEVPENDQSGDLLPIE